MSFERSFILRCPIDNANTEEILSVVCENINNKKSMFICGINVQIFIDVFFDTAYLEKIKLFHLIPDSKWIVIGARFLGIELKGQIRTPDLAKALMRFCEKKEFKIYFLGADGDVLEKCIDRVKQEYKNIQIAGYHHGYFDFKNDSEIVDDINDSGADVIFIGFPSPMKEDFIVKNIGKLNPVVSLGVGGLLDILGGKSSEAPLFLQKIGMEWFYRFLQEPRRLWKRYLTTNSLFIYLILKERLKILFS